MMFAYMRASSKTDHSIPLCPWHSHVYMKKTLPKGRKNSTKTKTNWDSFKGDGLIQNTEIQFFRRWVESGDKKITLYI